jgi:SNF2 family DNA or RNA helicase
VKYEPHDYQATAAAFCLERACAALFLPPGMGKTSIMTLVHKLLHDEGQIRRTLVVGPLRPILSVWTAEVAKWDEFSTIRPRILHGSKKDRIFDEIGTGLEGDLYLMNIEGLPWLLKRFIGMPRGQKFPFDMLIVDESSKFRNGATRRFKTLQSILKYFRRKYILTGSPTPNTLLDLFFQIFILDGGLTLGRYITHFRANYFKEVEPGKWEVRDGMDKVIYDKIAPVAMRMSREDYLKLPPLIHNVIRIKLSPAAQRTYDQFEASELLKFADGSKVNAANAGVAVNKLLQISGGTVYLSQDPGDPKGVYKAVHDEKLEALADLIEEQSGQPLMIVCRYKHEFERIQTYLGRPIPIMAGGMTKAAQEETEAAWNAGKYPLMLVQPQAVSHGLNLQKVQASVVWFTLTYSSDDYEQTYSRIWRQGQTGTVVNHHLLCDDTVDVAALAVVQGKLGNQQSLLDALRDYWRTKPLLNRTHLNF